MKKHWIIEPTWSDLDKAAEKWQVPPLIAQLLHNRDLGLDDDPRQFINPQLKDLYPPSMLPGTVEAAVLIAEAVKADKRIIIYGDYDVDGICGIAILWHLLGAVKASVGYYVPDRIEEGYGLNLDAIRKLVADGAEMIISVDCGITAVKEAAELRAADVPLIISDHHTLPEKLPTAAALVHPCLPMSDSPAVSSRCHSYPNPHLCGSGVAFKLAWAIAQRLSIPPYRDTQSTASSEHPDFTSGDTDVHQETSREQRVTPALRDVLRNCLPLAALGTIADVVPLVGENRIIAKKGLMGLCQSRWPGLIALLDSAQLSGKNVSSHGVGFKLAPRLNAAGRMGHARLAVELLTRASADRAREIAAYLEKQNKARQTVERKIAKQAAEIIEHDGMAQASKRAIVVAGQGWHAGVIGIVASRLVERFGRPTIVISLSGENGQGSGRSIQHFDLHGALRSCGEHLITFGGHAMAAGLRIDPERIDAFREAFVQFANNRLTPADLLPRLRLDAKVRIDDLNLNLVEWIQAMEPFGKGNSKPRLATDWVELTDEPRLVGHDHSHLQATFAQNGARIKAIGFGLGPMIEDLKQHRRCRIAFEPMVNDFRGIRSVEMRLLDMKFPDDNG